MTDIEGKALKMEGHESQTPEWINLKSMMWARALRAKILPEIPNQNYGDSLNPILERPGEKRDIYLN